MSKWTIICLVSACGLLPLGAAEKLRPSGADRTIARVVAKELPRRHFSKSPLDDALSNQIFEKYLQTLDSNRAYLLAEDVQYFARHKTMLDQYLPSGQIDIAFEMFERFRQRAEERLTFAEAFLADADGWTYEDDVRFELDRKEAEWFSSQSEQDEFWQNRLTHDMLNEILREEQKAEVQAKLDEEKVKDEEVAPEGETDAEAEEEAAGEEEEPRDPKEAVLKRYREHVHRLAQYESIEVLELFLSGFARTYDPHSLYQGPVNQENFAIQMSLQLTGIGARLRTEDSYVKVVDLIPGGPAKRDGRLEPSDMIIGVAQAPDVDPVNTVDMPLQKVVQMIRGEKGETVYLTVLKGEDGVGGTPEVIEIVRDVVQLEDNAAKSRVFRVSVEPELDAPAKPIALYPPEEEEEEGTDVAEGEDEEKDAGADEAAAEEGQDEDVAVDPGPPQAGHRHVAVIHLPSFYLDFAGRRQGKKDYRNCARDVMELIDTAVQEQEAKGIILDLRGNGGGSLDSAIEIAGFFFGRGPVVQVVQVRGNQQQRLVHEDKDARIRYGGPLVIMIDHNSASASEIVAACMQDYGRAVIIGESVTHGKGTVQNIHQLDRIISNPRLLGDQKPGALKYTVAKFYRVNGDSTQRKGVTPDLIWPSHRDHLELGERHLDGAMAWTRVTPRPFRSPVTITDVIPELQSRSWERLQGDSRYQHLVDYVAQYGEFRKDKSVSLSKEVRKARRQQERDVREAAQDAMYPEDAVGRDKDLLLDEALAVMADLIKLSEQNVTATTKASPGLPPQQ